MNMKILVIESEMKDFNDVLGCLPFDVQCHHISSARDLDIDNLSVDFGLCISDLLEETGMKDVQYESNELCEAFNERIRILSKLHQKLGCKLIINTKMPAIVILDRLNHLKDDPNVNCLFHNGYSDLSRELRLAAKVSDFLLYRSGDVFIVAKPYNTPCGEEIDIDRWRSKFTKLISHILDNFVESVPPVSVN